MGLRAGKDMGIAKEFVAWIDGRTGRRKAVQAVSHGAM